MDIIKIDGKMYHLDSEVLGLIQILFIAMDKMKSALEWYADANKYYDPDPVSPQGDTYAMVDGGNLARHTLNEVE